MIDINKIVVVTSLPGLFEIVITRKDGAVVRSLDDKATRFISSRTFALTQVSTVEIYTTGANINIIDLFSIMDSSQEPLPDEKDPKKTKEYFDKVYPELDYERVYAKDMKKIVKWYGLLKKHEITWGAAAAKATQLDGIEASSAVE